MKLFFLLNYKFLLLYHFQYFSDNMLLMDYSFSASSQLRNKACHGKKHPISKAWNHQH